MTRLHEEASSSFQQLVEDSEAVFLDSEHETLAVRQQMLLREMDGYCAYALDLDYMWRWDIYQDDGNDRAERLLDQPGVGEGGGGPCLRLLQPASSSNSAERSAAPR